jgi:hypothetical protein
LWGISGNAAASRWTAEQPATISAIAEAAHDPTLFIIHRRSISSRRLACHRRTANTRISCIAGGAVANNKAAVTDGRR